MPISASRRCASSSLRALSALVLLIRARRILTPARAARILGWNVALPAGIEPRPGDVVRAVVTHGAPHHLVADSALRTGHLPVRRTRAGDVWEARRAEPAPETRVTLGVPTVRR